MLTPRDSAAPPSTTSRSTSTLPIPTSVLKTEWETSTAREAPEPWGTTITVQRRSELRRSEPRLISPLPAPTSGYRGIAKIGRGGLSVNVPDRDPGHAPLGRL